MTTYKSEPKQWCIPTLVAAGLPPMLIALAMHWLSRFVMPGGIGWGFVWLALMIGLQQGVALLVVDLALHTAGLRALPVGSRAWLTALIAPFLAAAVWWLASQAGHTVPRALPMLAVGFGLRWLFGARLTQRLG